MKNDRVSVPQIGAKGLTSTYFVTILTTLKHFPSKLLTLEMFGNLMTQMERILKMKQAKKEL